MRVRTVGHMVRSVAVAMLAAAFAAMMCFVSSIGTGISLLAGTVLIMGGNDNPTGAGMNQIVSGYFDPANPGTGFSGYTYAVVPWNSNIGQNGYENNQTAGVDVIDTALGETVTAPDAQPIVVVGYSSSANVLVRELRYLDSHGNATEDGGVVVPVGTEFYLIGNPNRAGGGIFNRLGMFGSILGPLTGFTFDGVNPATDYGVTDITWKYDPVSDFPTNPLNLLALANTAIGFFTLHSNYGPADIDPNSPGYNVDDSLTYTDSVTGIRYLTLNPPELPLLEPLKRLGVPAPLLDAIRPGLTLLVESSYDRTLPATAIPENSSLRAQQQVTALDAPALDAATDAATDVMPPTPPIAPNDDAPSTLATVTSIATTTDAKTPAAVTESAATPSAAPQPKATTKPGFPLLRQSLRAIVGMLGLQGGAGSTPSSAPQTPGTPSGTSTPPPSATPSSPPSAPEPSQQEQPSDGGDGTQQSDGGQQKDAA